MAISLVLRRFEADSESFETEADGLSDINDERDGQIARTIASEQWVVRDLLSVGGWLAGVSFFTA